jgi:lysophospholipase L1-like esterase
VKIVRKLSVALGSIVVFLAAAEGLARIWYRPERIRYEGIFEYDRDKVYALKKNLVDGSFKGKPVTTNSFGHRDREIERRKPAGGFRVLAVGDSVTFGHAVNAEEAWPECLERRLAARFPAREIEVVNTAVPGNSAFQEYFDLERALVLEPDAVVIQFVLNDVLEPYMVFRRYGGRGRDYHRVEDLAYWDGVLSQKSGLHLLLKDMAARIRFRSWSRAGVQEEAARQDAQISWNAAADDPNNPLLVEAWRECLAWMQREVDLCKARGLGVVLLVTPVDLQFLDGSRTYAQRTLADFAARNGIAHVDVLTSLQTRCAERIRRITADAGPLPEGGELQVRRAIWREYFVDHDHFSPAGHEFVAELLLPLLAQRAATSGE